MPNFRWKGRRANGQTVEGELQAQSKELVVSALGALHISVTRIEEKSVGGEPPDPDQVYRTTPRLENESRPLRGLLLVLGVVAVVAVAAAGTCGKGFIG